MFAAYLEFIDRFTPNYWISVIVSVVIAFIVLIPLKTLGLINSRKKAASQPEANAIKKKYGINALGGAVIKEDESDMPEEIVKLTAEEREEKAYAEIDELYKKTGYKPFVGWIPGIAEIIFIVLLYIGITSAATAPIYTTPVFNGNCNTSTLIVIGAYVATTILTCFIRTGGGETAKKAKVVSALISIGASLLLGAYIVWRSSPCIMVGITTLTLCELIFTFIRSIFEKGGISGNKRN